MGIGICHSNRQFKRRSEGGSAKFPVRDDEHVSSFGAKGLEPEEYYQALIFWGGGVAVVLDLLQTRKR